LSVLGCSGIVRGMAESKLVRVERDGSVAVVTLDDPARRNAMSEGMGAEFSERMVELGGLADLRVVVLTGTGDAFSAGGDLSMLERLSKEGLERPGVARREIRDSMRRFYGFFLGLRELRCPTIAAINGHAIGAGLCVALACDLRVASREAKLAMNFTKLGIHPGMAGTWTLPRLVGQARAAELLYTGRTLNGAEAAEIGMVNRAVAPERVLPEALELAREIAANGPFAVAGVKQALARSPLASLDDQLGFEAAEQARCFETRDLQEGLAAGKQRRAPRFEGR
jgi:enoyl-CoA hydratase